LDKVVAEWSAVCGVRVLSEAIELGISIVGKESESARTLESTLITVAVRFETSDAVLGE
jgi:hypothetical protein